MAEQAEIPASQSQMQSIMGKLNLGVQESEKAEEPVKEEETPFDKEVEDNEKAAADKAKPEVKKEEKPKGKSAKKEEKAAEKKEEPAKEEPEFDEATQALINEYEGVEAEKKEESAKEGEKKVEQKATPSAKEIEYDNLEKDPFIKAVLTWRKSGGQNPKELIQELGLVGSNKSIEDYYREKAVSLGMKDEELEAAVAESIEDYNELGKLQQREILQNFQEKDTKSLDAKFEQYISKTSEQGAKMQEIQTKATETLQTKLAGLAGTSFKGMLIEEPMAKQIERDAALLSTPIFDEQGNLTGYDVEKGVQRAIVENYLPRLLKTTYNLGLTAASKKFAQERHRPNADSAGGGGGQGSSSEEKDTAINSLLKKATGRLI